MRILALFAAVAALVGCVGTTISGGQVKLTHAGKSEIEVQEIISRANLAIKRISRYWGTDDPRTIWIKFGGLWGTSRAYIDAAYITLQDGNTYKETSTIEHEIAHLEVGIDGDNRSFLTEGIAFYLATKFSPKVYVYKEVHLKAKYTIRKTGLISFDDPAMSFNVITNDPDQRGHITKGYAQSGSFVLYLIEKFGLDKFKRLYRGRSFSTVYKQNLNDLETEWRSYLQTRVLFPWE